MVQTVRMYNSQEDKYADVHPNEVENWSGFGWAKCDAEPSADVDEGAAADFSDAQLRGVIKEVTGKAAPKNAKRSTLVSRYNKLHAEN